MWEPSRAPIQSLKTSNYKSSAMREGVLRLNAGKIVTWRNQDYVANFVYDSYDSRNRMLKSIAYVSVSVTL